MNKPRVKPDSDRRVYVVIQDPKTRKSRQITLYGVNVNQAVAFIRESAQAANAAK